MKISSSFSVHEWAAEICKLDGDIYVATFNIAVFLSAGPATKVLSHINNKNGHLLVGVPAFKSCQEYHNKCKFCLTKHAKGMIRLAQLRDHYRQIDWAFVRDSHAKFAVSNSVTILGGRNLSDSKYEDVSVTIEDQALADTMRAQWSLIAHHRFDIGTNAPIVFTSPYKGEIMADSSAITEQYKTEIIKDQPQCDVALYWMTRK